MRLNPMRVIGRGSLGRRFVVSTLLIAAGAGLIVTAVATGRGAGPAIVELQDFRFEPNRIDARAGVPVTVTLHNGGTEEHDLNFPSLHMPGLAGVEAILQPGETRLVTLRFDEPGEHTFICTLPGHAAAGMTGAVFVRP